MSHKPNGAKVSSHTPRPPGEHIECDLFNKQPIEQARKKNGQMVRKIPIRMARENHYSCSNPVCKGCQRCQ